MSKLSRKKKRRSIYSTYQKSEIKRLLGDGVKISKIAKMLDIPYQLARTYQDLLESENGNNS